MNTLEKVRKPVGNKTMGIEIECILPENRDPRGAYHGFFYAGWDGSIDTYSRINGQYQIGVEFVSQPLSYQWMMRELDKLGKKYQWAANNSCGIHVHVSKKWLSEKRAITIRKALYQLTDIQCYELFGRKPNEYCMRTVNVYSRYGQLNSTNKHTHEFRMFASGDVYWAKECARRVKLLVEHRGKLNYDVMLELFTKPE